MKHGKNRVELGQYIVADPEICHGKPTFKGTRIMVWQVLDDVADGRSWDFICNTRWGGRVPLAAVAEAVENLIGGGTIKGRTKDWLRSTRSET